MEKDNPEIMQVAEDNISTEHICCAIGNDKINSERANVKKEWLKARFAEGLKFKKLNVRGKVFIEYIPAEFGWKPVHAIGYILIHCLWVSGRFKGQGYGKQLLDECLKDSQDKNGVIVISSKKTKPFLTDKRFFIKHGFDVCDTAPPFFELLVKKNNADAPNPIFTKNAKTGVCENKNGLTFYYSDQCPFSSAFIEELTPIADEFKIPFIKNKFGSSKDIQNSPAAFGSFSIFYNEELLSHRIPTKNEFRKMLSKCVNTR